LRASLKDLLFKDNGFRWNRLENLLRNARDSQDYDLNQVLDQTVDFLFSDRGTFIRENLVNEIVKSIDALGRNAIDNITARLRAQIGLNNGTNGRPIQPPEAPNSLDHLIRIVNILRETPGFDPLQIAAILPRLLVKPETQKMGQQIATRLAQRAIARFIREFLLNENATNGNQYRSVPAVSVQKSLPAAR